MNWLKITPETLPPVGVLLLVWDDEISEPELGKFGRSDPPKPRYTHYCIPTPPGTPPAVTAEVAKVLSVSDADLEYTAAIVCGLVNPSTEEAAMADRLVDHINAIRAARAALGMDQPQQEQQP